MKKIVMMLGLTILMCTAFIVKADSFRFEWEEGTTYIEVPLNADINNYINIPKVKLYRNNVLLTDAKIELQSNGDWLYLLTDVDTTKEGDYLVWYKANETVYQPGQCQGYKTLVTFHVVDLEPPVITQCPDELIYHIGSSKPEYLNYVKAIDNSGNVILDYYDKEVNYNKVGEYNVDIYAYDSNNKTTEKIILKVIDNDGPKIEFLGDNNTIEVNVFENVDLSLYFKAIDDADGDVLYSITYDEVDTSTEGKHQRIVRFYDTQGNMSEYIVYINVVDKNDIMINLISEDILIDFESNLEEYDFLQNVSSANYGNIDIKNELNIDITQLEQKVGVYTIIYSYSKLNKSYSKTCNVHILSSKAPEISTINVECSAGEAVNLFDFFTIDDFSDPDILESVEIDDSLVDYNNIGIYPVYISATNSSGLSTTKTLYVTVNKKPLEIDWSFVVVGGILIYLIADKLIRVIRRRND